MADELKKWPDMAGNTEEIIACGERWKAIASKIGCTVQGYNDDFGAAFCTPDGNVIEVGPKFRAFIADLEPLAGIENPTAFVEAARGMREALERISSGCTATFNDITNPTVRWMQGEAKEALTAFRAAMGEGQSDA